MAGSKFARWAPEELRMLETYAQALRENRYPGVMAAAREFLKERAALRQRYPRAKWLAARRTVPGIVWHIQERSRALGRLSSRRPWTAGEMRIVARYSRAIVRGKYDSVKAAAPDLHRDLLLYHQDEDPERDLCAPRTAYGAFARLLAYSRRHGRVVTRHVRWSNPEKRVLDGYARALLRGKYRNATEAARDCARDFRVLRRRYPKARWLAPGRSQGSVFVKLLERANRLGRRPKAIPWSHQELRMIDAYARRVVKGEFNAREAARVFLRETERLHERYPQLGWLLVRRRIHTAHDKIWRRAQELGRPFLELRWAGPEIALLKRFARGVVTGQYPHAAAAARAALPEIADLHARLPDVRWARMRRTFFGARTKVVELAHTLAEVWKHARFSPGERAVLERYAQAFIKGRFGSVALAAESCSEELARRHARNQRRRRRLKTPVPRSFRSVLTYLRVRTGELGRPRGPEDWSSDELRIAGEWSERYLNERHAEPRLTRPAAARGMYEELARHGFRRTLTGCAIRIAGTPRTDAAGRKLPTPPDWTEAELRVVNRYVKALLQGRYSSAYHAATDCLPKLLSLKPEPTPAGASPAPRRLSAVTRRIIVLARSRGQTWPGAWWSPAELDIIRPYAQALAEGRYSGTTTAGRAAAREIARLHKLNPSAGGQAGRTTAAVVARVQDLASEFGWRTHDRRWPREQKQLVLNHVRAYEQGEYDAPGDAARACRAEFERLSIEQPDAGWLKNLPAVSRIATMITRKAKRRNRPVIVPYSPQERARFDRLARQVISGKHRDCAAAARAFIANRDRRAGDGLPRPHPFRAVMGQISNRARALGRSAMVKPWLQPELAMLGSYSQDLIQGRYPNARAAAKELHEALNRLGQERPGEVPPRTFAAVCARLVHHSRAEGREANPHYRWTEPESRLIAKYADAVMRGEFPDKTRAADAYLKEVGAVTGDDGRGLSPHTRDAVVTRILKRMRTLEAGTGRVLSASNPSAE